jgi:hypothetical protein
MIKVNNFLELSSSLIPKVTNQVDIPIGTVFHGTMFFCDQVTPPVTGVWLKTAHDGKVTYIRMDLTEHKKGICALFRYVVNYRPVNMTIAITEID